MVFRFGFTKQSILVYIYMYVCMYVCMSVCLSLCLSVVCQSVVCVSVSLSVSLSVCLSGYQCWWLLQFCLFACPVSSSSSNAAGCDLNTVVADTELLDTSASKAKRHLVSFGAMARRRPPSHVRHSDSVVSWLNRMCLCGVM